ncbi:MAG: hypothetical protein WCK58_12895, partial [Chloroflexota bacterium]
MSDDQVERRVRDALRGAALPEAPATLRVALAALPDREPRRGWRGGRWLQAVVPWAAALAIVAVGAGGFVVVTRGPVGPAVSVEPSASPSETAAPSTLPSDPPAPPARVAVLDAAGLAAAIAA